MSDYTPTTEEVRAAASRAIGSDWFDRWMVAHDAQKRAEWEAEQGEPEGRRWFSAAYRARNGNVVPIGDENTLREFPEAVVEEFRREDPDGPEYFLASRILPPWLPVEDRDDPMPCRIGPDFMCDVHPDGCPPITDYEGTDRTVGANDE